MTDEENSGVRDNARHVQSQGGNNQLEHPNGPDPQDYEIPAKYLPPGAAWCRTFNNKTVTSKSPDVIVINEA